MRIVPPSGSTTYCEVPIRISEAKRSVTGEEFVDAFPRPAVDADTVARGTLPNSGGSETSVIRYASRAEQCRVQTHRHRPSTVTGSAVRALSAGTANYAAVGRRRSASTNQQISIDFYHQIRCRRPSQCLWS